MEQNNVRGAEFGTKSNELWFNPLDSHGTHVTVSFVSFRFFTFRSFDWFGNSRISLQAMFHRKKTIPFVCLTHTISRACSLAPTVFIAHHREQSLRKVAMMWEL
jgi:hypothetical protein